MFTRHAHVRAQDLADSGEITLLASTDDPVRMGDWYERLRHDEGAIDMAACRSLLFNHKPDLILGAVRTMATGSGQLNATAEIDGKATLPTGINAREAVKSGALRGVSIRYDYDQKDTVWDPETRTLDVRRWRLMELTLTPIPADPRGTVRSAPITNAPAPKDPPMPEPTAPTAEQLRAATERADKAEREVKLRSLATEHGVDTKGIDFGAFKTEAEGLTDLLARKAKQSTQTPNQPIERTEVVAAEEDKVRAALATTLFRTARVTPDGEDKALIEKHKTGYVSMRSLMEKFAAMDGVRGSDMDIAAWGAAQIDLRTHGRRSAANKTAAAFPTMLANVATKAILNGLNGANNTTWAQWCTQREVPNFLAVSNVGLASGRLSETPENESFPELLQRDGGYNSQLGLWGCTVSLTWQALINDQLGLFMDELRRAGGIAAQTVDREVYFRLLNASWTNDTSATAPLTTLSNLDKPRAALKGKLSPAGDKLGIVGRYLLHDPLNALPAQQATGVIYAGGQTTAPSAGSRQIIPIESHWIGDTALAAGALSTDYYLTGDGNLVDTVLVNFLQGVGFSPIIAPFDAGAVAAEKWKIMLPFRATVATHSAMTAPNTFATRVSGMQKATAA